MSTSNTKEFGKPLIEVLEPYLQDDDADRLIEYLDTLNLAALVDRDSTTPDRDPLTPNKKPPPEGRIEHYRN